MYPYVKNKQKVMIIIIVINNVTSIIIISLILVHWTVVNQNVTRLIIFSNVTEKTRLQNCTHIPIGGGKDDLDNNNNNVTEVILPSEQDV